MCDGFDFDSETYDTSSDSSEDSSMDMSDTMGNIADMDYDTGSFESLEDASDYSENVSISGIMDGADIDITEYELGEGASALDNMFEYMAEHNYGQDDFEIYSQDPEWQALNNDLLEEDGETPIDYDEAEEIVEGSEVYATELEDEDEGQLVSDWMDSVEDSDSIEFESEYSDVSNESEETVEEWMDDSELADATWLDGGSVEVEEQLIAEEAIESTDAEEQPVAEEAIESADVEEQFAAEEAVESTDAEEQPVAEEAIESTDAEEQPVAEEAIESTDVEEQFAAEEAVESTDGEEQLVAEEAVESTEVEEQPVAVEIIESADVEDNDAENVGNIPIDIDYCSEFTETLLEDRPDLAEMFENGEFYEQGNNEYRFEGTCGETTQANTLNQLLETNEFTENNVLNIAVENNLCEMNLLDPTNSGGTNTEQFMQLYEEINNRIGDKLEVELYDYDNALNIEDMAVRIEEGSMLNIAVDSNELWDQPRDITNTFHNTDHWISVTGVDRGEDGSVSGFKIIDSGGGESYLDADKFERCYYGPADNPVNDPTCIVVSRKG